MVSWLGILFFLERKFNAKEKKRRRSKTEEAAVAINTSRTNHSIFSDDFLAARPTNKETRCITRGRRQKTVAAKTGTEKKVVYCPAGNDETDGLLRDEGKVRSGKDATRHRPLGWGGQKENALMKCGHYRYRTKPTTP